MNKKYTAEQIQYIAANITGRRFTELTAMFNDRFGLNISKSAMVSLSDSHGLHNGRDCRFNIGYEPTQFRKGMTPWNKGKKRTGGYEPTQFKKGNKPANYKPVGTERTNTDGYVEIKIADPSKWKGKHIIIWEEANGAIPKGHVLLFADKNQQNVTLENLLLISRRELAVMNKRGLISSNAEFTKIGVSIADIHLKIGERKRKSS
jgi:hypothetical protein